jgi:hypothetical protein
MSIKLEAHYLHKIEVPGHYKFADMMIIVSLDNLISRSLVTPVIQSLSH